MWQAIPQVLEGFANDGAIRAVVLTGAGDKAFVSGAGISQFEKERSSADAVAHYDAVGEKAQSALKMFDKPVIAMIRGYCIGGGLNIANLCDLRIASDDARFGIPAAKMGLGYRAASMKHLVDLVGAAYALMNSYDGGQSWSGPNFDFNNLLVTTVQFAPSNPQVAYLGTLTDGVYRSETRGLTWFKRANGLPANIAVVAVDPTTSQIAYAAVRRPAAALVFKTIDGGAIWVPAGTGLDAESKAGTRVVVRLRNGEFEQHESLLRDVIRQAIKEDAENIT